MALPIPGAPTSEAGEKESQSPCLETHIESIEGCPDCALIVLRGCIDLSTLAGLRSALQDASGRGMRRIVLDCQDTTFVSASGIGLLAGFSRYLSDQGGELILAGLCAKVLRFFSMLGFQDYFFMADSSPAALEYLRTTQEDTRAVRCPSCGRGLAAREPGRFRCDACGAVLDIADRSRLDVQKDQPGGGEAGQRSTQEEDG